MTIVTQFLWNFLVLKQLKKKTANKLDECQFAYREGRSVDDAVLTVINSVSEHLENSDSCARALFIDFSSAFNTIKPAILIEKLKSLGISPILY